MPIDEDGNLVVVTFKKAGLIPSYPQDIFSVKIMITNGVTIIFKENKTNSGIKAAQNLTHTSTKRFDYLMTTEDNKSTIAEDVTISTRGIKY